MHYNFFTITIAPESDKCCKIPLSKVLTEFSFKKEEYSVPPEEEDNFNKQAVIMITENCPSTRALDCQEDHFFTVQDITTTIQANLHLTT